ncbi:MAG: hypothetical protein JNJ48_06230, partial [Phycisphaerae bacterium]|nr:hypothetical protein [Phycisphaerae bacterium]
MRPARPTAPQWPSRIARWAVLAILALPTLTAARPQPNGGPDGGPEAAPSIDPTLVSRLAGQWNVEYDDAGFGSTVAGTALVQTADNSLTVRLNDPRTGATRTLRATHLTLDAGRVRLRLAGRSPTASDVRADVPQGLPRLESADNATRAAITIGPHRASVPIRPRGVADLDTVELLLSFDGPDRLDGQWWYRADAVTRRDRNGGGRIGAYTDMPGPDAIGERRGAERWTRAKITVIGALVIADQFRIAPYGPEFPYPFGPGWQVSPGKKLQAPRDRRILVFGRDFPKPGTPASITPSGPGIAGYTIIAGSADGPAPPDRADEVAQGWARARAAAAVRGEDLDTAKLDWMLVRADMAEGVVPGMQPFTLNGSPGAWLLGFGDIDATLAFARPLSADGPDDAGRTVAGEVEPTGTLLIRETCFVRLRCHTDV